MPPASMDAPRRRRRKTVPNYNSYIQKAMKNIGTHDTTISSKAVQMINLIVKVGDKNVQNLSSHLDGLSRALEGDLALHRSLITDTVFDCVHWLQPKTPVYGTLVGLLNAADDEFGAAVATRTQHELQRALNDHAPVHIRGLVRFVAALLNARVLATAPAVELL